MFTHMKGTWGEPGNSLRSRAIAFGARKPSSEGITTAQFARAGLLAQKPWIVPVPGMTKRNRMEEKIGDADVTLAEAEVSEMDGAVSKLCFKASNSRKQRSR